MLCCFAVVTTSLALVVVGPVGHSQVPWEACELSWSLNPMEEIVVVSRAMGLGLSQCAARAKQVFTHPLSFGLRWSCCMHEMKVSAPGDDEITVDMIETAPIPIQECILRLLVKMWQCTKHSI